MMLFVVFKSLFRMMFRIIFFRMFGEEDAESVIGAPTPVSSVSSSSASKVLSVKANEFEMEFIEKVKGFVDSGNDKRICFDPDNVYRGGKPKPSHFGYSKRVYVVSPHQTFGQTLVCECGANLAPRSWEEPRRAQELKGCCFLLQRCYHCKTCNSKKTAMEILKSKNVPDFIKIAYPFTMLSKSCLCDDFVTFVTTSPITGQTFSETAAMITTFRVTKYLSDRAMYYAAVHSYHEGEKKKLKFGTVLVSNPITDFSSFDDPNGYHEIAHPTPQSIIKFFIKTAKVIFK
jgi:hypothetical protein